MTPESCIEMKVLSREIIQFIKLLNSLFVDKKNKI